MTDQSLYERLGGVFAIAAVIDHFSDNVVKNAVAGQGSDNPAPIVNGTFIDRNAGVGNDFMKLDARVSRAFMVRGVRLEGIVEVFNLTNRRNDLTRIGNFGAGAYPGSPAATFNQITAVGESRAFQLGLRARF